MATTTIADITPTAAANGWDAPIDTAFVGSTLFQHKFVRGDVVVTVLAHRNGVVADASRVNQVANSFTLVGETAPVAEFVLGWFAA